MPEKYQTKAVKARAEFEDKLQDLDTKAEVVEVLQDGVARMDAIEAEKDNTPIVVQPNIFKLNDAEDAADARKEPKTP